MGLHLTGSSLTSLNNAIAPLTRRSILPSDLVASVNACYFQLIANGSAGTGFTLRNTYKATVDCTDLQLVFNAWYAPSTGEAAAPNTQILKAAVVKGAKILPVTFNLGLRKVTIDPWSTVKTDPVGLDLVAGDTFEVHVLVDTPASGSYLSGPAINGAPNVTPSLNGYGGGDSVDGTPYSGNGSDAYQLWGPVAICGRVTGTRKPQIALVGDSIIRGTGDLGSNYSFATRALNAGFSSMNLGTPSETVNTAVAVGGYARRGSLIAACDYAIVMYGTNDVFAAGRTAVQVEADLVTMWTKLVKRGMKVYACTLVPQTTSTDSWATSANQAVKAAESVRTTVNDWIRTTPSPLSGYFDTADKVEVNAAGTLTRNGGRWVAGGSTDGIHPKPTQHASMAAAINTALFV